MMIEINRFMTMEEVQVAYSLPESLAGKILPSVPHAIVLNDGTRLYLESEVDQFLAEFVRKERFAESRANPPAPGRSGRRVETLEIAVFANELRCRGVIWKKVFRVCKERWPEDERVDNEEQVRGTWRRFFDNRSESD